MAWTERGAFAKKEKQLLAFIFALINRVLTAARYENFLPRYFPKVLRFVQSSFKLL